MYVHVKLDTMNDIPKIINSTVLIIVILKPVHIYDDDTIIKCMQQNV